MKSKRKALAQHLGCKKSEIEQSSYYENIYEYGSQEYLVVTDEEADDLWDEDLENYIDECLLPEVHESVRRYFDREAWKSDARHDGRGHSLGRYDGHENSEIVKDEEYYIYRQN